MAESVLNGTRILAVDDETDVLATVEDEIQEASHNCTFEKATTYEKGQELINSNTYDIVILDIMGVRGFDLLEIAVQRNFKVAMLTAHALNPEALKRSYEAGARAYLPKEKLGEIVPFLEDVIKYEYKPGWNRLFDKLDSFFSKNFGADWVRSGD